MVPMEICVQALTDATNGGSPLLHRYCTHTVLYSYCTHTVLILYSYCTHTALILHSYCVHGGSPLLHRCCTNVLAVLTPYCTHTVLYSPLLHSFLPKEQLEAAVARLGSKAEISVDSFLVIVEEK
jgi:hypothetical protein